MAKIVNCDYCSTPVLVKSRDTETVLCGFCRKTMEDVSMSALPPVNFYREQEASDEN